MKPKILIFLLGLTGFGACGEKEIPVAYGVPTARFTIKGTVTDPAGNPLEGIRITPVEYRIRQVPTERFIPDVEYVHEPLYEPEAVYTDETGAYAIRDDCFDRIPFHVVYRAEDTDGPANGGEFVPRDVDVEITSADRTAQSGWVSEYAKEAAPVVLEKKE